MTRRRLSRRRGMTLVEVMVATALAGVMAASMLMIVRAQLIAYETNDSVSRAQQNARVALDLLESMGRRACGGLSVGQVGINVPSVVPSVQPCVRFWDGANQSGGTFSTGTGTTTADALEIVYGSSPFTAVTSTPSLSGASPSVGVANVVGFSAGDYVIISANMQAGVLMKVASVSPSNATTSPTAGTLSLSAPGGTFAQPSGFTGSTYYVMKGNSYAFYVQTTGAYANMLMLDPDGMAGTAHSDAQPLADGVIDLQVAIGADTNGTGVIVDNGGAGDGWYGNAAGETVPLPPSQTQTWNNGSGTTQVRQIRVTAMVQTLNQYGGAVPTLGPFEDRTTYPATTTSGPRYRTERVVIAPRAWNLLN